MRQLLNKHQLNAEHEYFDLCILSYRDGIDGRKRAQNLFEALQKKDKKVMLTYIIGGGCNNEYKGQQLELLQFFINCL